MTKRTRTLWGSLAAAAMISLVPMSGAMADGYWQCVPFARLMSGIQIFGDARFHFADRLQIDGSGQIR